MENSVHPKRILNFLFSRIGFAFDLFFFWLEANLGPLGNFYTNIYIYIPTYLCVRAKLFFSLFLLLFILRTLFFHLYVRIKIFNF